MALLAKPFSASTKVIKKAQNLLKPLSAIFVQICCYKVLRLLFLRQLSSENPFPLAIYEYSQV
jgi:hypothetical protein